MYGVKVPNRKIQTMHTAKLLEGDIQALHLFGLRHNSIRGKNNDRFWSADRLKAMLASDRYAIAVSKEGSRIVAYCIAFVLPEAGVAFVFNDFHVMDTYRGKGVRQALLAEIHRQLKLLSRLIDEVSVVMKACDALQDEKFFRASGFVCMSPMTAFAGSASMLVRSSECE